jgi:hypothetical protein
MGFKKMSSDKTGPELPTRLPVSAERAIAALDARALGVAVGVVAAASILLATLVLLVRGGDVVGPHLSLLSQYFVGYGVSLTGAVWGSAYALALGFLAGYAFGGLRNLLIRAYLSYVWRRAERRSFRDLLDRLS